MRIVFFGTPEIAIPSLRLLAKRNEVTAVVCQPDKPQGRSKKLVAPPAKVLAEELGIPVQQPTKLNDGKFEAWLRDEAPDVCVLVAYGRILKQPVLDVPTHGFLNLHPSALPMYRGPAPIQGALLDGLTETAVSIMQLDAGMDTGPVAMQKPLAIEDHDTAESLSQRAGTLGALMLGMVIEQIENGTCEFHPQNDANATYTKLLTKEDGRIHWNNSAESIRNLVRAANPWPGAQCSFRDKPVRIWMADVLPEQTDAAPGTIVASGKDYLHVATGDGLLSIVSLQPAGKKPMFARDFLNGADLKDNETFGELG